MTKLFALLLPLGTPLALALAACGDNTLAPDAMLPDAAPARPRAIVVAGDYIPGHPGVLSSLDIESRELKSNVGPAMAVGSDPMLRHIGNELFVVNRNDGNNVTILDDQTLALKEQLGTGAGSNPQDVAVVGNKLYVPVFGGNGLAVLTRGSTTIAAIDLSADDPDGKPNCNSAYAIGGEVYVSCELLDNTNQNLPPRGKGKIYVVDAATGAVKKDKTLELGHENPFGVFEQIPAMAPNAGDLVIPTVKFADNSGCIERITPGAPPKAAGCMTQNADLGGFASHITFQVDKLEALMLVSVSSYPKELLRTYDLASATLWPGSLTAESQTAHDTAVCPGGELVVADATMNTNGLRIYSGTAELTKTPLAIGLPPSSSRGLVCY